MIWFLGVLLSILCYRLKYRTERNFLLGLSSLDDDVRWQTLKNLTFHISPGIPYNRKRISKKYHFGIYTRVANFIISGNQSEMHYAYTIFERSDNYSQLLMLKIMAQSSLPHTKAFLAEGIDQNLPDKLEKTFGMLTSIWWLQNLPYEAKEILNGNNISSIFREIFDYYRLYRIIDRNLREVLTHCDLVFFLRQLSNTRFQATLYPIFAEKFFAKMKALGPFNKLDRKETKQLFEIGAEALLNILNPVWSEKGNSIDRAEIAKVFLVYSTNPQWLKVVEMYGHQAGYERQELRVHLGIQLNQKLQNVIFRNGRQQSEREFQSRIIERLDDISNDISEVLTEG